MNHDLLFKAENLTYSYDWNRQKVLVLKSVSFELKKGCFTCLIGPSGSGKTTLLNLLGLIESPEAGHLKLLGQDITQTTEDEKEALRLKNIGFVFQSFYLIPTLTALENTQYFLPLLGYNESESTRIAKEILDLMGLKNHFHKKPLELSGGQRQRVAIARALAKKPSVILADEPTANLDSETADTIITAFKELRQSQNTSFIFATHDSHLMSYAEEIFQMKDGVLSFTQK